MATLQQYQPYIWIALAVLAVLVVVGLIASALRTRRTARLREKFGPEYDRTVETTRSRTRAEQELIDREERVRSFNIVPLNAADRDRFRSEWQKIEARFIELPTTAVVEADELLTEMMRLRGYPMGDFEKRAADLSAHYPRVVEHYRLGHRTILAHQRGAASTEDLRQAMLHYRTLFTELLGEGDVASSIRSEREVEIDRRAPEDLRDERRV